MHDWGESEILALLLSIFITVLVSCGIVYRAKARAARQLEILKLQQMVAAESARVEKACVEEYTSRLTAGYCCAVCQAPSKSRCSRCKSVRYCSSTCQSRHWNEGHQLACKAPSANSSTVKSIDSRQGNADAGFKNSLNVESNRSNAHGNVNKDVFGKGFIQNTYNKFTESTHCNGAVETNNKEDERQRSQNKAAQGPLNSATVGGKLSSPRKILFSYASFLTLFDRRLGPPCGLINCGNSCFANVVLQCLTYTRPLAAYFLLGPHHQECRRQEWCFMCDLQEHVIRVSRSEDSFSPIRILSRLRKIGNHLGYGRQEDAHEFMRFAIDSMQSICLDEAGGEKGLDIRSQETTLIHYIFGGHLQSQVKCMQCLQESNTYENMMDLTVEIQGPVESLEDALAQYTAVEWLDGDNKYRCDRCAAFVKAKKRLTVHEAPNILTIALKRFQSGKFGKLNKRVTFPEQLDMSPYMSRRGDGLPLYQLYAVVVHVDMLNASFFGHYICYVKDMEGVWYKIDDSKVKEVDLDKVMSQNAYMLFYSRSSPRAGPLLEDNLVVSQNANYDPCKSNLESAVEKSSATSEGVPDTGAPLKSLVIDKSRLMPAVFEKLRDGLGVSDHELIDSRSHGPLDVEGKCTSLQDMDVDIFTEDSGSLGSNSSTSENDMDSSNNSSDESSNGALHAKKQEGYSNGHILNSVDVSCVSTFDHSKQETCNGRPLFTPGFLNRPPASKSQKRSASGTACTSVSGNISANPFPLLADDLDREVPCSPLKFQKPVCNGKYTSTVDPFL